MSAHHDANGAEQRTTDDGRPDERREPEYLDRDKLDFDPDDGLLSGTAVDGTTEIPGPHAGLDPEMGSVSGSADKTDDESGEDAGDRVGAHRAAEGRDAERVEQGP